MDWISDEGIFLGSSSRSMTYRIFNSIAGTIIEYINVVIDDSITEQRMDNEDNVGTSSVQIDETVRELMCEFTSTESVSSQASKSLPTEGQIEKSKELITRLPNKEEITESNKKISNDDICFSRSIRSKHVLLGVLLKMNSEKVSLHYVEGI